MLLEWNATNTGPAFPGAPSPLMAAAQFGRHKMVKLLLESDRIDAAYSDGTGHTALHAAIMAQNLMTEETRHRFTLPSTELRAILTCRV